MSAQDTAEISRIDLIFEQKQIISLLEARGNAIKLEIWEKVKYYEK